MEFKEFPKEYEDVFTAKRTLKKCNINLITTDIDMDINSYIAKMHNTMSDFQTMTYDYLVKTVWLFRRFCYRGRRRKYLGQNGVELDGSFAVFLRRYVGFDARVITKNYVNQKVISYFDDFYPDFDISNPFEMDFPYPYKHMNFEMLALVCNMPERLDILEACERRKMGYTEFFDYIINYVNCYNDEHGETYEVVFSRLCLPYIKKHERKEV